MSCTHIWGPRDAPGIRQIAPEHTVLSGCGAACEGKDAQWRMSYSRLIEPVKEHHDKDVLVRLGIRHVLDGELA